MRGDEPAINVGTTLNKDRSPHTRDGPFNRLKRLNDQAQFPGLEDESQSLMLRTAPISLNARAHESPASRGSRTRGQVIRHVADGISRHAFSGTSAFVVAAYQVAKPRLVFFALCTFLAFVLAGSRIDPPRVSC